MQHTTSIKKCACSIHLIKRVPAEAMCFVTDRIYDLTLFSYLFAFGHFTSELLIFRTASFGFGALSPVMVSSECTIMGSATMSIDPPDRVITCRRVLNLDDHAIRLLRAVNPRRENPLQHRGNQGVIALSSPRCHPVREHQEFYEFSDRAKVCMSGDF
jgi:hypothetical protein